MNYPDVKLSYILHVTREIIQHSASHALSYRGYVAALPFKSNIAAERYKTQIWIGLEPIKSAKVEIQVRQLDLGATIWDFDPLLSRSAFFPCKLVS